MKHTTRATPLIFSIGLLGLAACAIEEGADDPPPIEASVEEDLLLLDDEAIGLAPEEACLVVAHEGDVVGEIERGGVFHGDDGRTFDASSTVELEASLLEGFQDETIPLDVLAIEGDTSRLLGTLVPESPGEPSTLAGARCGSLQYPWWRILHVGCCSPNVGRNRKYRCHNTSNGGVTYTLWSTYCVSGVHQLC